MSRTKDLSASTLAGFSGGRLTYAWALAAALMLALVAFWPGARVAVFHWFNDLGPYAPHFWSGMTAMADTYLALGLLLPVVLLRPRIAGLLLLAALIATAVTHSIKPMLDVLRPPAVLPPDSMHLIGHRLTHKSFPSGHAVTAFVLAGLVIAALRPRVVWALSALVMASLMAISRMAVGVHWPTDVLAGAFIGLASVALAEFWLARWPTLRRARWAPPTAIVVTGICALTSPWFDVGYPEGLWANWLVAWVGLVSLAVGLWRYWPSLAQRRRLSSRNVADEIRRQR